MRKKLFFILALPFVLAACNKSTTNGDCGYTTNTTVAPAAEIANLKAYLDVNSLPYTQHPSGIFYKINAAGSGIIPDVCSDVTVRYIGRTTTNANPFDQNTTGVTFKLGQLIAGWQIGIPLIQKGGSIILYIPPTLGYGAAGAAPSIPPNAYLIFNIELVNVM